MPLAKPTFILYIYYKLKGAIGEVSIYSMHILQIVRTQRRNQHVCSRMKHVAKHRQRDPAMVCWQSVCLEAWGTEAKKTQFPENKCSLALLPSAAMPKNNFVLENVWLVGLGTTSQQMTPVQSDPQQRKIDSYMTCSRTS